MGQRHTHFIIQGYGTLDLATGNMGDVVIIDVIADTEQAALTRAQRLVKKNGYRVSSVVEHDPSLEATPFGSAINGHGH